MSSRLSLSPLDADVAAAFFWSRGAKGTAMRHGRSDLSSQRAERGATQLSDIMTTNPVVLDPENTTPVRDVMTSDVIYCFQDEDIEAAARKLEEHQIRRLIVLNRDKRLVGIASLGDLAVHAPSDLLPGEVTEAVSEPS